MIPSVSILQISDLHRERLSPIRNDVLLNSLENDRTRYATGRDSAPIRSPDIIELRYLEAILRMEQVPEKTIVDRIPGTALSFEEAMCLVRVRGVLLDDYFMPDVDLAFASISHGVAFHVERTKNAFEVSVARDMPAAQMVVECYNTARDVFDGFVKNYIRGQCDSKPAVWTLLLEVSGVAQLASRSSHLQRLLKTLTS